MAAQPKGSLLENLNAIAGTSNLSVQDVLHVLAATVAIVPDGLSAQEYANIWADTGDTFLSLQDALNLKADSFFLSAQDASYQYYLTVA